MRLSFNRNQEPIKMSVWLDLSCKADFDTSASGSEFIRSYALPYKILSKFKKIIKRRNIKINQTIICSIKACFALAKNSTSVLCFASFKVYEGNQVRITLVVPWAYYAFWVIFFLLLFYLAFTRTDHFTATCAMFAWTSDWRENTNVGRIQDMTSVASAWR